MIEIVLVAIYAVLLSIILIYCVLELGLAINYLRYRNKSDRHSKRFPDGLSEEEYPMVTIQLPVFNELYVVERLIDCVVQFEYPKSRMEIQVLDDSTDESKDIAATKVKEYKDQGFDIVHITREDRTGFKAGALQAAMKTAKGEFIAIFDADFVPDPDFLLLTLPHFANPQVGVVQTRWKHLNQSYSLLTRVQAFFLDAHFTVEQAGRNYSGHFMNFNGTAGVWRSRTITDAGGWKADTLTEDLDLSYRAQMKKWKFVYLEEVLSPAELPADIKSFKSQQFRWIKGGAETAKKILPTMARTDFSFSTKMNAFAHLLSSSVYLVIFLVIILSVPLLLVKNMFIETEYVYFGMPFFISNIAVAVVYFVAFMNKHNRARGILNYLFMLPMFLVVTMGLSLHNALAVLRGYWGEQTPFIRTPKFNIMKKGDVWKGKKYLSGKIDKVTVFEGLLILYFLAAIVYGIVNQEFSLIPLHIMAVVGFSTIFIYSISHTLTSK